MKISVVIPTFNRREILLKVLRSLDDQTLAPAEYEIIVVDDGSTDGTLREVPGFLGKMRCRARLIAEDHRGPASARNAGILRAEGEVVFFTGDDIVAGRELLHRHREFHRMNPGQGEALLGHVTWDPALRITPFMRWLENGGPQFKYWAIEDHQHVSWRHFYTCNISLKKRFLLEKGLFNEDFPYAAYEDSELGHRLAGEGLRIVFDPQAVGYHHHPATLRSTLSRMRKTGYSRRIFREKTGIGEAVESLPSWRRSLSRAKFLAALGIGLWGERRIVMGKVYAYLVDWCLREGERSFGK